MDKILEEVFKHADESSPNEACGLIVNDGVYNRVIRCENISPFPESQFIVDPVKVAQFSTSIVAVYHSHVKGSAEPSESDKISSDRCKVPYLIVGLESREVNIYTPDGSRIAPFEGRRFIYGVSDCITIVYDYYLQEMGKKIPCFSRDIWGWWENNSNKNAFIENFTNCGFEIVRDNSMVKGDVVIMQIQSGIPNHAAVYAGDSVILHHPNANNLSRYEVYGGYWQKNTVCVLRLKNEEH